MADQVGAETPRGLTTPKRIQRKRTKGWRMPKGAIYVGRPTIFGNPFWHAQRWFGLDVALSLFADTARGCWSPKNVEMMNDAAAKIAYNDHCEWLNRIRSYGGTSVIRMDLRGHDLACWCRLDKRCHADILLEIANG